MANDKLQTGDAIRWRDNWQDPPVKREGRVICAMSMQYLVVDSRGIETFVFKKDAEQNETHHQQVSAVQSDVPEAPCTDPARREAGAADSKV